VAEPGVWPPGAASPSAKSIQEDEIPLVVMAGRMKKVSENRPYFNYPGSYGL